MEPLFPEEIELAEAELAEILEAGGGAGATSAGTAAGDLEDPFGSGLGQGFEAGGADETDLPGSEPFEPSAGGPGAGLEILAELPAPDEDLDAAGFGAVPDPELTGLPELPAPDEELGDAGEDLFAGPWTGPSGGPLDEGGAPQPDRPERPAPDTAVSPPYLCYCNLFLAKHYCQLYQQTGEVGYLKRCRYYYARFLRCRG